MSEGTKWYNCPVFCGQEPGFMGGAFDDEDTHKERTVQARKLAGNPIDKSDADFSIYFHGELEYMIGFDIVSFIDGTFPKIKYGDKIKSITYTPDGKKHDTIVYVGEYKSGSPWSGDKLYCIVLLASETPDLEDMEGGTVKFHLPSLGNKINKKEKQQ